MNSMLIEPYSHAAGFIPAADTHRSIRARTRPQRTGAKCDAARFTPAADAHRSIRARTRPQRTGAKCD